ncbi:hypothetical protein, partial [uncultured phage MedDCM-OCT-S12-C97]
IYGRLRKFVGQAEFEADVNSPLEAISFLACNFKGIDKHMANQHYAINCGDLTVTEELLNMQTKSDIQIIPLAHGNFFFSIILGAGALFGSSAITTAGTLLGSKLLATVASTVLTSVGTSMLIGGVTELHLPHHQEIKQVVWMSLIQRLWQVTIHLQGFQTFQGLEFQ